MADTLSLTLKSMVQWAYTETVGTAVGTIVDSSKLEYDKTLADGTASDLADKVWRTRSTISSSDDEAVNVNALATIMFGYGSVSLNLQRIKAVLLINLTTTSGEDLWIGNNGVANPQIEMFNGSTTTKIMVPADSVFFVCNKKAGWASATGARAMTVHNSGNGTVDFIL